MTRNSIKNFFDEFFSKPPKKNYPTNKTDEFYIDDTWSLDILDLEDYSPENNRGHRYVLVIIDNFSKYGWTVPLKNKNAQTKTNSSENFLIISKRKPSLIKTDRGKKFSYGIFQNFLNNNNNKQYSRNTYL